MKFKDDKLTCQPRMKIVVIKLENEHSSSSWFILFFLLVKCNFLLDVNWHINLSYKLSCFTKIYQYMLGVISSFAVFFYPLMPVFLVRWYLRFLRIWFGVWDCEKVSAIFMHQLFLCNLITIAVRYYLYVMMSTF